MLLPLLNCYWRVISNLELTVEEKLGDWLWEGTDQYKLRTIMAFVPGPANPLFKLLNRISSLLSDKTSSQSLLLLLLASLNWEIYCFTLYFVMKKWHSKKKYFEIIDQFNLPFFKFYDMTKLLFLPSFNIVLFSFF